jgi:hypothetical protein
MPILRGVNQRFFQTWTPEMAYVLGFFAADGNMIKNRRGAHFVSFYSTDEELLEMVRGVMGSTHKIGFRIYPPPWKIGYKIQIGSKQLFNDLIGLGMTPNKSLTLKFPDIPAEFFPHFVRGYFDGDGCIYFKEYFAKDRQKMRWAFTTHFTSGSRAFLISLHDRLQSIGLAGGAVRTKTKKEGRGHFELIYSHQDSLALARLMYDTIPCDKLYLDRKYQLFQKAKNTLYGDVA